ncbi:uncharacterized protein LOC103698532 isoform X2 [Phoenix dactylifera]|uniref:Uncharacterized protein LOC103698532 isoform X2 n=1 Tax=Phoenix dactylifera TaxID=42345 RepID=A0A8B9AS11_PHODC|nr:uncharacterized protein LOC103698532 isoform X2 [Phoenix dactylifera]
MATQFGSTLSKGQFTNRPPLFNGTNYTYWKAKMRIFIQAQDYDVWSIIINGPYIPTHIVDNIAIPKLEKDWDNNDKKRVQLNAKAMNVLYCALDTNEFNRISTYISAKEIWDRLEVTHEDTNQVKEFKINMLVHKYELFKMEPSETITCMFTRFTDIINGLKSLGKTYSNSDLVRKVLRSLPCTWEAKVTAIQEAKDLNTLPLEKLLRSLMTHELTMKQYTEKESQRRKVIAFKFTAHKKNDSSSSEDEEEGDEEEALVRKFKRFLRKKKPSYKKRFTSNAFDKEKGKKKEKEAVACYECKKPDHFRADCPLMRKYGKKKKLFLTTWSETEDSSSEEEPQEKTNLCLMADGNEINAKMREILADLLIG